MSFKEAMLKGELKLPLSDYWEAEFPLDFNNIKSLWWALWRNYLRSPKDKTSIPYWYGKFNSESTFRTFVGEMAKAGWITTTANPTRNWGDMQLNEDRLLEIVNPDELTFIRKQHKFAKYVLCFKEATHTNLTKQNRVIKDTGLVREGFALAGNTQFGIDIEALQNNEYVISRNLTKGMEKVKEDYPELKNDEASYDEVSLGVMEHYMNNPCSLYTTGNNYSDSRGRAISDCLSKVGNPISSKDFRALLVVTYD